MLFDSLENCTPVFLGSVGRWPSSAVAAVPKSIHKMKQQNFPFTHMCEYTNHCIWSQRKLKLTNEALVIILAKKIVIQSYSFLTVSDLE